MGYKNNLYILLTARIERCVYPISPRVKTSSEMILWFWRFQIKCRKGPQSQQQNQSSISCTFLPKYRNFSATKVVQWAKHYGCNLWKVATTSCFSRKACCHEWVRTGRSAPKLGNQYVVDKCLYCGCLPQLNELVGNPAHCPALFGTRQDLSGSSSPHCWIVALRFNFRFKRKFL